MIISGWYSKSSNSSGFNPILQKLYKVICEKIEKIENGCRIFLIFCWSSFINNFMLKNGFLEPKNYQDPSRDPSTFKKFLQTILKVLSVQISLKDISFEKNFFLRFGAFFTTAKPLIWAPFFSTKNNFKLFSRIILKTYFKDLFSKTAKKW